MRRTMLAVMALGLLGGCASIVEGTSQQITVNTDPQGAACELMRDGQVISKIARTPAEITVQKTKHDITIACALEGFAESTRINESGVEEMTAGNIILGGLVGWAIDSATGADNEYDDSVLIVLEPMVVEESVESESLPGVVPQTPTPTGEDAIPQS